MSFDYDFTTKEYFPNGINIGKLDKEIKSNTKLNFILGLTLSNDLLTIVSEKTLVAQDREELLILFKNHSKDNFIPTKTIEVVHIVQNFESNITFTFIIPIIYPKILSYEKILGVWVVACIDTDLEFSDDFYELRLYNVTENNIVAANKFNNIEDRICKLKIKNNPTKDSYLELQAKTENEIKISVKNITLLF